MNLKEMLHDTYSPYKLSKKKFPLLTDHYTRYTYQYSEKRSLRAKWKKEYIRFRTKVLVSVIVPICSYYYLTNKYNIMGRKKLIFGLIFLYLYCLKKLIRKTIGIKLRLTLPYSYKARYFPI